MTTFVLNHLTFISMKKIGLIGGMSWESSRVYYDIINRRTQQLLGGFHSSKCVMESVDFAEIEKLQHADDWKALDQKMAEAAVNLENASADLVILCTNTMHLCSEAIASSVKIPFLHIAGATGKKIKEKRLKKVLLLGTNFTMEKGFYKDVLQKDYDIEVMVPDEKDRKLVHEIIYQELVLGKIVAESKATCLRVINEFKDQGVEGVILGCTEIPLLIGQEDVDIPVFDTTKIHAEAAVQFAINGDHN